MSENIQLDEASTLGPTPAPAQRYSAALDSVNLINARIAAPQENQTEEQRASEIKRNVEHLKIAVAWDIWTNEDLTPLQSAIIAGGAWIS